MRLLYVVNALAIHGGLERIIIDKVNWLAEHTDNELYVATADQGSHPVVFPLHPKVIHFDLGVFFHEQYRYSGLKRWRCTFRLHKLFQSRLKEKVMEISPDIVICSQKQYVGDVDKARGSISLVFECHSACLAWRYEGYDIWHILNNKIYDWNVKKTQMVVALTEGDAEDWRKITSRVKVIPNMAHLNDTGRMSDCHSKMIIFVGRYTVQKDIGSLLRIWDIVHLRHPDWQLHLYGGYGNQPDKWQNEIAQMNANVFAHDPTSQIFERYLDSSILLLTSLHEPFGLVLPEAMSCGLPVVAFDCPFGPSEIINDGTDGFLIKDRNIEQFAERVCQLIEDDELRCRMGKAAADSSQRYRADVIMPRWIELFEEITNKS